MTTVLVERFYSISFLSVVGGALPLGF